MLNNSYLQLLFIPLSNFLVFVNVFEAFLLFSSDAKIFTHAHTTFHTSSSQKNEEKSERNAGIYTGLDFIGAFLVRKEKGAIIGAQCPSFCRRFLKWLIKNKETIKTGS